MACVRTHALQRAVETLREAQGLPELDLPELHPVFDGPEVRVRVAGRELVGRLSGHRLLAAGILGALLRVPGEPRFHAWLPSIRAGGRRHLPCLSPADLWAREGLLVEAMCDAGLAWLAAGQEEEGVLCLRRVARGSPEHPRKVEPPMDPDAPDVAQELRRVMGLTGRLLDQVPAPLRDSLVRPSTEADRALRGRAKSLTAAIAAVSGLAGHPDPIERAAAAEKLGALLAEINLGRTDPGPIVARTRLALEPLLEDVPFVKEPAFNAMTVAAERLHTAGRSREALPWLDRLVGEGLLLREHLAMRSGARRALGDTEGAEADQARATALQGTWPPGGIPVEDGPCGEAPSATRADAARPCSPKTSSGS